MNFYFEISKVDFEISKVDFILNLMVSTEKTLFSMC